MIFNVIVSNPAFKNFERIIIDDFQYHTFELKTYKKRHSKQKKKQQGTLKKFP